MNQYIYKLKPIGLPLAMLLTWQTLSCDAQALALGKQTRKVENTETASGATRQLRDVLNDLRSQYRVDILFSDQMVEGQTVPATAVNWKAKLEKNLSSILKPCGLQYKKAKDGTYLITRPANNKKAELERDALAQTSVSTDMASYQPTVKSVQLVETVVLAIKGKVTDEEGVGLPGVSIVIKGTTTGTATDANGAYSLNVPDGATTLVFSFIGYLTQEVAINQQTTIDISLKSDVKALSEIVVVGYGEQKKTSTTAAVATLKATEVSAKPVVNLTNNLGGRIAGVIVKQGGGEPGFDGASINIRGINSYINSAPLLVVDGIYRDFSRLDPNSIESFTVLKDAAAVAPYGLAGANGVILVTTKRGKLGTPTLTYNGYVGFQNPTRVTPAVNAYEYALMRNEANANDGQSPAYTPAQIAEYKKSVDGASDANRDLYPNSNPLREIIKPDQTITYHNLEFSGGTDKIRYYMGLSYTRQNGMWTTTNVQKYNLMAKIETDATQTTKVGLQLNGWLEDQNYPNQSAFTIVQQAFRTTPVTPVYFSNGLWGQYIGQSLVGEIYHSGYQFNEKTTIMTNFTVEQQLPFIKGLSVKGVLSVDPTTNFTKGWLTPIPFYVINTTTTPYTFTQGNQGVSKPVLAQYADNQKNFTYQGYLNYHNTFGKHDVTVLGVAESRNIKFSYTSARRQNYNLNIDELSTGSSSQNDIFNAGSSLEQKQVGFVYRVGYSYADKYLIEAAGRYDGHFAFAPGRRYGFFPSFSVGWRLSEEPFLKEKVDWLDNLKIRASYGESGNLPYRTDVALVEQQAQAFAYLSTYGIQGTSAVFDGQATQGLFERSQAQPSITWERAKKSNLGIEASFWRGKLGIEADVFYERRNNILRDPTTAVPVEYGIALGRTNAGIMSSQGFEVQLNFNQEVTKDLRAGLSGNFTYAKNKLIDIAENSATFNNPNRRLTDRAYGTLFGLQALGYYTTDDFNSDGSLKAGMPTPPAGAVKPGDLKYADLSGSDGKGVPDGKIDNNDQVVIGPPTTPQILFGLTPRVSFKGFDLDVLFQGAAQTSFYLDGSLRAPFQSSASATKLQFDNHWTPENPNGLYPRLSGTPTPNNTQTSSWWRRDASYVRIKSLQLSYTLPSFITNRIKAQTVKVYISGQNLWTWTPNMKEIIDPEASNNSGFYYFQQSVWSFGGNITF
ncbi:MAG: TonB-dependent receptor [Bacteroidota bacterium]